MIEKMLETGMVILTSAQAAKNLGGNGTTEQKAVISRAESHMIEQTVGGLNHQK